MQALINAKIVTEDEILEKSVVLIKRHCIENIHLEETFYEHEAAFRGYEKIDLDGQWLMPGFIDIHVHGSKGCDVMDGTEEALRTIQESLVKTGVTSFLATTMTQSEGQIRQALKMVQKQMQVIVKGSRILGAHLEGPFISKKAKGAHVEAFIQSPQLKLIKGYEDTVKLITIAPETDHAKETIACACAQGIRMSLGHSACTYNEALEAIEAGATSVTHLFNAMSPLNHRDPGLVGAALTRPVYAELIADTVHSHPDLYSLVLKAKGVEKVILITDAMKGQCMNAGRYDLGGQVVVVDDSSARLDNGVLAGSILTQQQSLKNILKHTDLSMKDAAKLLSTNAANLLGLQDIGRIAKGSKADLTVVNEQLEVTNVWIGGQRIIGGTQ